MTASAVDVDLANLADLLSAMHPDQLVEWLDAQPPEVVDLAEEVLGTRLMVGWRATPVTMAHHLTRGRIKLWRYARLLGVKFRDAVEGRSKRQIWNLPSRYGKSTIASRWGPTWALDRDPTTNLILVSYGDALADENAVAVRDQLDAHASSLRARLRADRRARGRFVTTEGGGLWAAGIDSALTGVGGDGIVVDDPLKNWQEAHSTARREHIWSQYRAVIRLRADEGESWIIVVHHRWHEDDLSGQLLSAMEDGTGEAWELVRLPAIAEAPDPRSEDVLRRLPDPLGRAPGEVLEPERFDLDAVKGRHLSLGSYLTSALEQQRPAPEEGGELKRAWWRLADRLPEKADEWLTSWDPKLKDKETGDYVVGQVWARTGSHFWLCDQLRGQYDQAATTNAIALLSVRWPQATRHVVENTGNGPEVMEALTTAFPDYVVSDEMAGLLGMTEAERVQVEDLRRRGMPGLVPNTPKGSKQVRARAVAPYVEAGNVHVPAHASWLGAFLDETAAFGTGGGHDDQVDAFSQALSKLAKGHLTIAAPSGQLAPARPTGGSLRAMRPRG